MASVWQEAMESSDQAQLAGLHAQADQEAMYMMWEELDHYQQFRHALVGTTPPVPSFPPQYMAMYPEAATATVPFVGSDGSIWPADVPPGVDMMQWFNEADGGTLESLVPFTSPGAGLEVLPWCGDGH
mmetsp:Transcript_26563/g.72110  ORF Transcript_26563/g.72110 Transcript_26563/m.72110 type:complete len:128 (-) Transcript_26563:10-393(-)